LRRQGVGGRVGVSEEYFARDGLSAPLFLFFGWYRSTVRIGNEYAFVREREDPGVHALFGWLQVERKVNFTGREDREKFQRANPWALTHPHVGCCDFDGQPNALYIAPKQDSDEDRLILDGERTGLKASGMFSTFDPEIHTLTRPGHTKRNWRLPSWFFRDGRPVLGMHGNLSRWDRIEGEPNYIHLQSVDKGQEFVFDSQDHNPQSVRAWVTQVVEAAQGRL